MAHLKWVLGSGSRCHCRRTWAGVLRIGAAICFVALTASGCERSEQNGSDQQAIPDYAGDASSGGPNLTDEPDLQPHNPVFAADESWRAWVVPQTSGTGAELFFQAAGSAVVLVPTNGDPRTVASSPQSDYLVFLDSSSGTIGYDSLYVLNTRRAPLKSEQVTNTGISEMPRQERALVAVPNPSSQNPIVWDSDTRLHYGYRGGTCSVAIDLAALQVKSECNAD